MKKEKAYCQKCDKDVNYVKSIEYYETTINNVKFSYPYIRSKCIYCGESVYPSSITRLNEVALFDAYKEKVGLLTSKEIIAIRKKLGLTQEGLAKEMGCGLKTITRYENGAVQDKAFDNHIRCLEEIYDLKQLLKSHSKKQSVALSLK